MDASQVNLKKRKPFNFQKIMFRLGITEESVFFIAQMQDWEKKKNCMPTRGNSSSAGIRVVLHQQNP